MPDLLAEMRRAFRDRFQTSSRLYRAPGRVNLIGEHTDYNEGFVMPVAIDFHVWVAIAPREDRRLLVHSLNFSESVEIDLQNDFPAHRHHWSDYVQGVVVMLKRAQYPLRGANVVICGDVPIGSGLSSSAAIEVATGFALLENSGIAPDRIALAKLCRRAEVEFVGARVGIMDQFISCCAHAGQAMMLDCRSLGYRLLPLPSDICLVICNTMIKHELSTGEYNSRREECEKAVRLLARVLPDIRSLRDVTTSDLDGHANELPEILLKRVRHVVSEDARVEQAATALQRQDLATFGRLMSESHHSLRDDYQVSCPELDLMVELATAMPGVHGARMTGAGFGGCTITLVDAQSVEGFKNQVSRGYERKTGIPPLILVSSAAQGVGEVGQ